jgi:hypothetical protein
MSLVKWVGTQNSNWSTGSNWSSDTAPQTGDDVQIETSNAVTVTYNTGTLFLDSLTTAVATLDVTAGTLGVYNGYSFGGPLELGGGEIRLVAGAYGDGFAGNVTQTGGTMVLLGGAVAQFGEFSETAGTLSVGNGSFIDQDQGTFTALVTGDGRLVLDASAVNNQPTTITLGSGFAATINALEFEGVEALDTSLTYANIFALDTTGTVDLDGNTLKLTGNAGLDGVITDGGIVDATGTGHLNGLLLDNGVMLSLTGTYNQTGAITLGSAGSGTLEIGAAGALRLTNNGTIFASSGGDLLNDGLLAKVGGGPQSGESVIYGDFTNASTGTIDIAVGTLDFRGPSNGFTNALAGTITGPGTVSFDAGDYLIDNANHLALNVSRLILTGSATMTLTTALSYAGDWDQTNGTLVVGSPGQVAGSLTLTGATALDGGLLKGTGTVLSSGAVNLGDNVDLEGNLQFIFEGPVSQTSNIELGLDADAITIASITKGNSWNLKGDASILGFNAQIDNAGTFAMASGAGVSVVQSGLINTGTLAADSGELLLSGVGTLGGSVVGSAVLDISGAYEFASGLSLSVGTVILDAPNLGGEVQASLAGNLSFANSWAQEGGTLSLLGYTLTLHGVTSLQAGAIEGPGEVIVAGSAVLGNGFDLLQGAEVKFNGNTEQNGNVTLTGGSEAPTLTIGAGGTYTMSGGTDLGGPGNSIVGTVVVDGTLVASGVGNNPSPANVIAASLVDDGKIKLSHGEMQFLSSVTGSGSIILSNGATLDLLGSTSITNAITFGSGGGILDLGTPGEYTGTITDFGSGDMVELTGFTLSAGTSFTVQGDTVTLSEQSGQSATLTFNAAQTPSQLTLGEGPHGGLALIHL